MKKITDITGVIKDGMWNYEPPFPKFQKKPLQRVPWLNTRTYCDVFEGMHSQTGTYLETPAHWFGYDSCKLIDDWSLDQLYEMDCLVIRLDHQYDCSEKKSQPIKKNWLEEAFEDLEVPKGCAILLCSGWGAFWDHEEFLPESPYIENEAMQFLINQKPILLGSDFPRWDNIKKSEDFFEDFYRADILMLAPLINLETIQNPRCKLTVLPIRVFKTCAVTCRAVIVEENP